MTSTGKLRAGFIGLGNIGLNIAQWIARGGVQLSVYDVTRQGPDAMRAEGATIAASPADIARNADIIGVCVRDGKDVTDVLEGENGILKAAKPGLVVAIHSTIGIGLLKALAQRAGEKGVRLLDVPVSRDATAGPKDKPFVFMIGGAESDVATLRPFLEPAAKRIVHAGELGAGMALKVCNNMLTYNGFIAIDNAARLAEATGLPLSAVIDVVSNNGNASPMVLGMMKQRAGQAPATTRSQGAMGRDQLIALAEKDLDCALEIAADLGIALPLAETARRSIRGALLPTD